jgi:hypothetical protein
MALEAALEAAKRHLLQLTDVQFTMAIFGCFSEHISLVYFSYSQCDVHYVQA